MALLSTKTGLPSFSAQDNAIVNYFTDGGFERGSNGVIPTGWAQYNDGASATPVDGTGGSAVAQVTMLCTNSSPIRGTLSAVISKDANNRQGVGYSFPFTISNADKGITAGVNFELLTSANYVAGDMVFYIYDVTNSTLITPRSVSLPALPSYGKFFSDYGLTAGTSYRFILHIATASALAYTVTLDTMVNTTTRVAVPGAVVSEWISYTPSTIQGLGTTTSQSFKYRKVGTSIEITCDFTSGTPTAVEAQISLPTGLNADTSSNGPMRGKWWRNTAAGTVVKSGNIYVSGNLMYFAKDDYTTASSPFTTLNGNSVIGVSERVNVVLNSTPISEWAGSGSNFGPGASVEYASSTTGTWDAAAAAINTVYGPDGSPISGALTADRQKVVQFQNAIQTEDIITLEYRTPNGQWVSQENTGYTFTNHNSTAFGAQLSSTTTNTVTFFFYRYRSPGPTYNSTVGAADWSPSNFTAWRARKARATAPVGQVLASTDGREGLYKAGQAPGSVAGAVTTVGMIGETPGSSASVGSGGTLYSKTTTTNFSTAAAVVTLTLNKGIYIVSGCTSFTGPAGGGTNASIQIRVGGTAVTSGGNQFGTIAASNECYASTPAYPIVITTDSTSVDLYCTCGGTGGTNTLNELCAVRIA